MKLSKSMSRIEVTFCAFVVTAAKLRTARIIHEMFFINFPGHRPLKRQLTLCPQSAPQLTQQANTQSSHLGNSGIRAAWLDEVTSQTHRLCLGRPGQLPGSPLTRPSNLQGETPLPTESQRVTRFYFLSSDQNHANPGVYAGTSKLS